MKKRRLAESGLIYASSVASRFTIRHSPGFGIVARRMIMVPYPPEVIDEIDKIVSHRKRTAFLIDLAKREIKLNRQRNALRGAKGAWKPEDHPELEQGAAAWVREIRQGSLKHFEKIEQHREGK